MGLRKELVLDPNAGWQDIKVSPRRRKLPDGQWEWACWIAKLVFGAARWVILVVGTFVVLNWLITASAVPAVWAWSVGLSWLAIVFVVLAAAAHGALFLWVSEPFDRWVASGVRMWWRRLRYYWKWPDVMAAGGLRVRDRKRRELAPRIARIRQGRYADTLTVRLPAGVTAERFREYLPEITEAMRAREAQILPAIRMRVPSWLRRRVPAEFTVPDFRAGTVYLRLAFGDPLAQTLRAEDRQPVHSVDLSAVPVGRCDDGTDWRISLLSTHVFLAGATGSGKGSVLWAIIKALGPAIRDGAVQVVGLDPKGGMELGFGRELFRELVTMDGRNADEQAVEFLEGLAEEADRRSGLLAGTTRVLQPSAQVPFLLIVIDELASVTALIADSKLRARAEAALGRLLTKGRAPGMCVLGSVQDPRKEVVKWRGLFPTRVALRLIESVDVDMVLGDGARKRGARCDDIPETAPGVGYVTEDGSKAVTRIRADYVTDDDIRSLAQTYRPGPVVAPALSIVEQSNDQGVA